MSTTPGTGETPPSTPGDRAPYVLAGLPWFDYDDADAKDLAPSLKLAEVGPVGDLVKEDPVPFSPVHPCSVVTLKDEPGVVVADGDW